MIVPPVGCWWLAYEDGCVWPVEVLRPAIAGQFWVLPVHPAPDAGTERLEPRSRIYDSHFNPPRVEVLA